MESEDLVKETVTGSREPAACLTLPLLPYQKEFLAWGLKQELSSIRGGVLAGAYLVIHDCIVLALYSCADFQSLF